MNTILAIIVSSIITPVIFMAFAILLFAFFCVVDPVLFWIGFPEAIRELIEVIGGLALLIYAPYWWHLWKYKHNPIYREDDDEHQEWLRKFNEKRLT